MASFSRAAAKSSILTSIRSTKTSAPKRRAPVSLRTPARVKSEEVNPLKKLEKTVDTFPPGANNRSPFAG